MGPEIKPNPEKGQKGRKGYTQADLEAVEKRGGTMSLGQVLRCRVRYFTDRAAIGSAAFIEKVCHSNRGNFGPKRASGIRPMRGTDWYLRFLTSFPQVTQRHPPDARS